MSQPIELHVSRNVVRIRIGVDGKDRPFLSLNDSAGRERVFCCLDDFGNGSIGFRTHEGHPLMSLGISSELGAGVSVIDFENDTVVEVNAQYGEVEIRVDSKQGDFSWPDLKTTT